MLAEFKGFLTKSNALALAVGVIIGAATGKVVSALVADILMPIITMVMPEGDYRTLTIALPRGKAIAYGDFLGVVVDFILIALVVFLIVRALVKPEPKKPMKDCPFCLDSIPEAASKCRSCGSAVA